MHKLYSVVILICLALCSFAATAQYKLEIGAGIFTTQLPHYPGADQKKTYVLPMPYIFFESENFELERNRLTGFMWNSGNWHLDLSAGAGIKVNSDDNEARVGMPDLDWVFELGPSLKYYLQGSPKSPQHLVTEIFTRKAIATDFSSIGNVGWRYGPAISYQQQFMVDGVNRLALNIRVVANFSDKRYLDYYYGVNTQYASDTRPEFHNKGGYAGSDLSLGLTYKTRSIWTGGYLRYYQLSDAQQVDSPLFFNTQGWSFGLGIVWIFYHKKGK